MTENKKIFVARPINKISDFNHQVDIIIPYHGQYEKTLNLIESILRVTRSNYYKICVVDDASPNSSFLETINTNAIKIAERTKRPNIIKTIRSEEQKGYAGACRIGFEATESPYVCFINSDCRIEDSGWLKTMGESLLNLKSHNVRMVCPTTNEPLNGDPAQKGEKDARSLDDIVLSEDSVMSLYCFLCHRQLFQKIGGFLKEYPYGGYEDEEVAFRMKKYGFKQAVCRGSWVYHEGKATFNSILRANPNLRQVIENENRKRCIEDMRKII